MRILLVDDDEFLMASLAEKLIRQRYAVDIAVNGSSAHDYVELFNYDLIVLDLMLPDGDGIEFCKRFRRSGYINPLMILTAKASTAEKVSALDAGADDYVIKPFDFDELCARIRALLRREHEGLPTVLQWGALQLDPSVCEFTYASRLVRLTPKEFSLMELFLRHPYRVHSLGGIIDDLWSLDVPPGEDAVRTHIKSLRRKLRGAGAPKDLIKTVYGLGYRLNERAMGEQHSGAQRSGNHSGSQQATSQPLRSDRTTNPVKSAQNALNRQSPSTNRSPTVTERPVKTALTTALDAAPLADLAQSSLAQAACRYLHNAQQLITDLEKSAPTLLSPASIFPASAGSQPSRQQPNKQPKAQVKAQERARIRIHKLAGSLGSFGFTEGSKLAKEIEARIDDQIQTASVESASVDIDFAAAPPKREAAPDKSAQPPYQDVTQLIQQLHQYIDAATRRTCALPTPSPTELVRDRSPTLRIISRSDALSQKLTQAAVEAGFSVQVAEQSSKNSAELPTNLQAERAVSPTATPTTDPTTDLVVWDATTIETLSLISTDTIGQQALLNSLTIALVDEVALTTQRRLVAQGVKRVMSAQDSPADIVDEARRMFLAEQKDALLRVAIADDDLHFLSQIKKQFIKNQAIENQGTTNQGTTNQGTTNQGTKPITNQPEGHTSDANFWLKTFTDSQALWQWLHAAHPSSNASLPVDVLILDIEMPNMDGIELCRVLRADSRFQRLPIVFLSIHDSEAIKERAFQAGADDFLSKASTTPRALARWLQSRRFTFGA